ncbi:penicillin-binding protein [Rhizobium sp. KVB221]|uniref:Penicillin-binding protein n=1 Tax=Rhizobium setariae TaxID=2801340 RepID=A0A937CM47_9HYPH|nr:transglycosylase domain-containing protein [Rhizobium setariae]MBL0370524.1 penicillin-binding protein [Rhizobium setariae]
MAAKSKSGKRIEPSFDGGGRRGRDDDLRADPRDRATSKTSRAAKPTSKSSRSTSRSRTKRRSGGGLFGFLRRGIYWMLVLGLWGGIAVAGLLVYYGSRMPSAESWAMPDRPPNIKIVDVNGSLLANRGSTGGEAVPLDSMSPYIPQAVMAIEDRRFYSHFGVDPIGLSRAMMRNAMSGRMVQGGSTLTQQLAKNMFLTPERTLERKVQELLLAFWLESKYTKEQILAMYLNRVFFGSNSYGVEAASRRYFNKSARDVNLTEAAILAGLLKAPSALSPAKNPEGAMARAKLVLAAMEDQGYINHDELTAALDQKAPKAKSYWSGAEHYAADMVMDELPGLIGEVKEDIVVDTTIDKTLEKAAEKSIQTALDKDGKRLGVSQAALVSIDGTGAIRAVVGGREYAKSQFNRAFKAKRQPGSAFKPFVYAAALEQGLTPGSVRNDAPVRIGKWTPENYDNKYRGQVTLANALANSLNTIAAQLVMEAGPQNVSKLAHRMGIETELQDNASIALGTSEVSLVELTAAYAPFMNGGFKATPHVIKRVTTVSGKVLYENTYDTPPKVISEKIAAQMNMMMAGVITRGTGKKAKLPGWQVAGKSGTTQSFRDALFVGYSANLTTGVWFGNDDGASMKKVTGGGLPAQTWSDFMIAAHKGLAPAPLFGLGGVQMQDPDPVAGEQPQQQHKDTLFEMISNALGGDGGKPTPEVGVGQGESVSGNHTKVNRDRPVVDESGLPAAEIDDVIRHSDRDQNNGLVPPMDVGRTGANPQPKKANSTLLDVIMQE